MKNTFNIKWLFPILLVTACAHKNDNLIGEWMCVKELPRNVTKFQTTDIAKVKASILNVEEHKIYLSKVDFIDTCHYSSFRTSSFFDGENREPNYIMDGPLAVQYTKKELAKFEKIDFTGISESDRYNCLNKMYLNEDTLILNYCGGVTFFFVRKPSLIK